MGPLSTGRDAPGAHRGPAVRQPAFESLWEQRIPPQPTPVTRTFLHPDLGTITLECDILTVRDSDLRLLVYTAAPGSEAASRLDLLATIGLQQLT
ncbi:MAG TPA: hypothetical protein VKY86_04860 [Promicromonospora sp.]|nr:hypothetical protein [Promicromonospora sp.]